MARPPKELVDAARGFVCVRVTDMRGVDLATYRFDFDLTLAMLFMNADGTVYHRYGGRDWRDPAAAMSIPSLVRTLQAAREEHARTQRSPSPPASRPARTIEDLPTFRKKTAGKPPECVHCHTIHEEERATAIAEGRWRREDLWIQPDPARIGLVLERDDQRLVREVAESSPAARAGLRPGDRLARLAGRRVATFADVAAALHDASGSGGSLAVEFDRGGKPNEAKLELAAGWKAASPLEYSWRPYKWGLKPGPGFGGSTLGEAKRRDLGLGDAKFAMRVDYVIDWGEDSYLGKNVLKAGLRRGDVIFAADGKGDFETEQHFQSWFRLTRAPGATVEYSVLRDGRRLAVRVPVVE